MLKSYSYNTTPFKTDTLKEKIIFYAKRFNRYAVFNSNGYSAQNQYNGKPVVEFLLAAGSSQAIRCSTNAWQQLKVFVDENRENWIVGHLSYDLKNENEKLTSGHPDELGFPGLHFFIPEILVSLQNESLLIYAQSELESRKVFNDIMDCEPPADHASSSEIIFSPSFKKNEYVQSVKKILKHIQYGDVYELNFCMEFSATQADIHPDEIYIKLNKNSPAPFSCLYKLENKYLISASPERFLAKYHDQLFSQPIKGTAKRGDTIEDDMALYEKLRSDPKERSENIMIVDLVRNDLSRSCIPGTVKVDELCGIYSFPHVHQMISTISGTLAKEIHPVDAIKVAFPMGSMTGAPKVRAMELIEIYERTKRGLYSGSVGFFTPEGDFDFNVVIRSLQYNAANKYLSVMAGSAITSLSDPENEYEECLLKAQALINVVQS